MLHDFKSYPELTNAQLAELAFDSPHPQILADFEARIVKVHDGDTVTLQTDFRDFTFPLRLLDVDAPELGAGGEEAAAWLKDEVEGEEVWINVNPDNRVDKYGRLLGRIVHLGLDVSEVMLAFGLVRRFEARHEGEIRSFDEVLRSG